MAKTYRDWGDGKKHTVSLKRHQKDVKTRRAAKLNDPAKFVAPRGATDVNRDANTFVNLKYGEKERAQAQQKAENPVYYQNYRDQISGLKAADAQGYQRAIGETMARQQATAASDTTARNTLGSQMQADAASRGATVDPSLLANDVNAANVRNTNQSAFANLLGAQQQAQANWYSGQQQVGAASQLESQRLLAAKATGTAADKGLDRATYVTDAREKERTNLLQRAAFEIPSANTALTQKTSSANSKRSARSQRANRKVAKRQKDQDQALARSRLRTEQEKIAYDRAHPKAGAKGGSKSLSKSGRDTTVTIRKGVGQVAKHNDGTPGYWKGAFDELVDKNGLDPVVARAIIQGARHGKLGPKTKKGLRDTYGIDGIHFSKPRRRTRSGGTQWPTSKRPPSKPKTVLNPFD